MDAHSYDEHKRYRSTLLEIHKCGSKHMKKDGIQENDKWHLYYICYCFRIYIQYLYIYIHFVHFRYLRRDRYEKHVKVYWVEKGLQGRMLLLDCNYG